MRRACTLCCCWSVYVSWWEGGLAFVCVCACDCVFFFLVNGTEGGKAMPGLYLLQSSVSIIEEWYLQRGAGVRGRSGEEERKEGIKQKEGNSYFD